MENFYYVKSKVLAQNIRTSEQIPTNSLRNSGNLNHQIKGGKKLSYEKYIQTNQQSKAVNHKTNELTTIVSHEIGINDTSLSLHFQTAEQKKTEVFEVGNQSFTQEVSRSHKSLQLRDYSGSNPEQSNYKSIACVEQLEECVNEPKRFIVKNKSSSNNKISKMLSRLLCCGCRNTCESDQ